MNNATQKIEVKRTETSKINQVDFDNLPFGSVFTDHMLVCDYKNGAWEVPKIVPYQPLSLDPSSKVFHYGQSIFEGMKAYKDKEEAIWLFRPLDNHKTFKHFCKKNVDSRIARSIFYGRPFSSFAIRQTMDP